MVSNTQTFQHHDIQRSWISFFSCSFSCRRSAKRSLSDSCGSIDSVKNASLSFLRLEIPLLIYVPCYCYGRKFATKFGGAFWKFQRCLTFRMPVGNKAWTWYLVKSKTERLPPWLKHVTSRYCIVYVIAVNGSLLHFADGPLWQPFAENKLRHTTWNKTPVLRDICQVVVVPLRLDFMRLVTGDLPPWCCKSCDFPSSLGQKRN